MDITEQIQSHCQSCGGQGVRFLKPPLTEKIDAIARDGRNLVLTRHDKQERTKLVEPLSLNSARILGSGIDGASHANDEASWEWVNHPSEHRDQLSISHSLPASAKSLDGPPQGQAQV